MNLVAWLDITYALVDFRILDFFGVIIFSQNMNFV